MTADIKTADEMVTRMIELAENKYNCSQIMMILALEQAGQKNPGLVRAVSGLGDGCGFFKETFPNSPIEKCSSCNIIVTQG